MERAKVEYQNVVCFFFFNKTQRSKSLNRWYQFHYIIDDLDERYKCDSSKCSKYESGTFRAVAHLRPMHAFSIGNEEMDSAEGKKDGKILSA